MFILLQAFTEGTAYGEASRKAPVRICDISAGTISMALDSEGNVYTWGDDKLLGNPVMTERDKGIPLRVSWMPKKCKVQEASQWSVDVVTGHQL